MTSLIRVSDVDNFLLIPFMQFWSSLTSFQILHLYPVYLLMSCARWLAPDLYEWRKGVASGWFDNDHQGWNHSFKSWIWRNQGHKWIVSLERAGLIVLWQLCFMACGYCEGQSLAGSSKLGTASFPSNPSLSFLSTFKWWFQKLDKHMSKLALTPAKTKIFEPDIPLLPMLGNGTSQA